ENENVRKLEYFLRLFQGYAEGDVSQLQVDRVEQQLLQGRSSQFQRNQNFRDSLDRLKLQLGIPTDLPLELDEGPVTSQRQQLARFERLISQYEKVRDEASELYKVEPPGEVHFEEPGKMREALVSLAATAQVAPGTTYRPARTPPAAVSPRTSSRGTPRDPPGRAPSTARAGAGGRGTASAARECT